MSETPDETIARLTRERDLAREECGHEKAMRQAGSREMDDWVKRGSLARAACIEALGLVRDDRGITWDIASLVRDLAGQRDGVLSELERTLTPRAGHPDDGLTPAVVV